MQWVLFFYRFHRSVVRSVISVESLHVCNEGRVSKSYTDEEWSGVFCNEGWVAIGYTGAYYMYML